MNNTLQLSFKKFVAICNRLACNGLWSLTTAMLCIEVMSTTRSIPFWKRKKAWDQLVNDNIPFFRSILDKNEE